VVETSTPNPKVEGLNLATTVHGGGVGGRRRPFQEVREFTGVYVKPEKPYWKGKEGSVLLTYFRLASFYIENIIYLCYNTSYLSSEVNGTEPSPSVSFSWLTRSPKTYLPI
jgi:hypothetical protein